MDENSKYLFGHLSPKWDPKFNWIIPKSQAGVCERPVGRALALGEKEYLEYHATIKPEDDTQFYKKVAVYGQEYRFLKLKEVNNG